LPTATPLTQAGFDESYLNTIDQLAVDGLSETEWRQLYESDLLRQRLLDEITADVPRTQEQAWARHILVPDEAIALVVRGRLDQGEDFAAVAAEVSTDTSNKDRGGDLGWFGKGAMVPEFETAAFTLSIGEISEPVKSQFGWHIIQVLARGEVTLTAEAYESARQSAFETWLTEARAKYNVVTYDSWRSIVPDDPAAPVAAP
jgi:parvulin-like peptidyl-prolyl isomerase